MIALACLRSLSPGTKSKDRSERSASLMSRDHTRLRPIVVQHVGISRVQTRIALAKMAAGNS
jgi:hypothetical protein